MEQSKFSVWSSESFRLGFPAEDALATSCSSDFIPPQNGPGSVPFCNKFVQRGILSFIFPRAQSYIPLFPQRALPRQPSPVARCETTARMGNSQTRDEGGGKLNTQDLSTSDEDGSMSTPTSSADENMTRRTLNEEGWLAAPLLKIILILPILTFITTYSISLSNGMQEYPYLFLSVSIESKPASCFGTFGLSLTCLLAPFLAFVRYSYIKRQIVKVLGRDHVDYNKVKLWNRRALFFAIYTGVGGHGVASFQVSIKACF